MFRHHYPMDFRMSEIDRSDPEGRRLLQAAKRAALAEYDGKPTEKPMAALEKRLRALDTGSLNVLSAMWMLWHPNVAAGATGRGGIWAMATEVVNDAARRILHDRPMFEVFFSHGPDG